MTWNAGRIICALVRSYDFRKNRVMTEFEIDGGRCDFVLITAAGYLTEFEVKVSLSDWNADREKAKWLRARPHVSRFYYAVPETLESKIPAWLPPHAGVLVVRAAPSRDYVREVRPARRLRAQKLPDGWIQSIYTNSYYKYWHLKLLTMRARRPAQERAAA